MIANRVLSKRFIIVGLLTALLATSTAAVIVFVLQLGSNKPRLGPTEITLGVITSTMVRIEDSLQRGAMPANLSDLPIRSGYHNSTIDGWGHDIRFFIQQSKDSTRVRVVSAGPDGIFNSEDDFVESAVFDANGLVRSRQLP